MPHQEPAPGHAGPILNQRAGHATVTPRQRKFCTYRCMPGQPGRSPPDTCSHASSHHTPSHVGQPVLEKLCSHAPSLSSPINSHELENGGLTNASLNSACRPHPKTTACWEQLSAWPQKGLTGKKSGAAGLDFI